ncbi:MAG TPA: hypothetical protein VNL71_04415, partial [Chloroflexota bacterium]|nr:hypothetical protein [Chloroflexota bacterium]
LCASAFALARRHGHPRAGWLAVILLANVTWLTPEVPATLNDFAAAAMLVLGLNDTLIWLDQQSAETAHDARGLLLLARAGCLMGFSASFKLSNLPVAPAVVLTVGVAVLMTGTQPPARRLIEAVRAGFVVGATTLLTLGPWLLKAYVLFGHPFYPMAVAISYTAPGHTGNSTPHSDHVWSTITSLTQVFTASLGPLAVLILLAPLLVHAVGGRAMQGFLIVGGLLWIWFVPLYGEPRYYIPLIAIGAALTAAVICRIVDRLPFPPTWSELPLAAYLVAHSLLMLALSSQQAINGQAGTIALGGISRYSYLAAHVAPYAAEEWVNEHSPPDAVIALVHTTLGYYLDRDQLSDWYSARRLRLE